MKRYQTHTIFVLLFALLCAVSACGGTPSAPATKPTVQILVPAYGESMIEGDVVAVQAFAVDASNITRAELYVDGQLANTKLSQNPQGEAQFNTVFEWLATRQGAHTLTVRAFNTAGVSGEVSIPIAVNPRLGAPTSIASGPTPVPDATEEPTRETQATEQPTAQAATDAPTDAVPTEASATQEPATPEPPTEEPPTRALPTVTLPPFAAQGPGDGGADVNVVWSPDGLFIEAQANASAGIDYVEFGIHDLEGRLLASRNDDTFPYCYFGDEQDSCRTIPLGSDEFLWRSGVPIQAGWYFIRAVVHTSDNRIIAGERALRITIPEDSFEDLFVSIVAPFSDVVQDELVFEADVSGTAADVGIKQVDMYIVLYNGQIVHKRTEQSARYCGFSGGENGQDCPPFALRQNAKWSSGTPVYPTQYLLRAVAVLNDGKVAATARMIQIDILP